MKQTRSKNKKCINKDAGFPPLVSPPARLSSSPFTPLPQIRKHIKACPNAGEGCPFGEWGCDYAGGREVLQKHLKVYCRVL